MSEKSNCRFDDLLGQYGGKKLSLRQPIRFKGLKSELVYQQDFHTQATAKQAVLEYIKI